MRLDSIRYIVYFADMSSHQIVLLLHLMAHHTGRTPGTVGHMVSGRRDTYPRLARGHDLVSRRATQIMQRLSDHWPADLDWPSDIPRPEPSPPSTQDQGKAA